MDDFTAPMSPVLNGNIHAIPLIRLNGANGSNANGANGMDVDTDEEHEVQLTKEEEDDLLRQSTAGFADWIATFFRRVIALLESLPEDMPGDSASSVDDSDGTTYEPDLRYFLTEFNPANVIDVVLELCEQICIHLSDPLFDLVLTLVYDYATTTVRSNATRCMHKLVKCVAAGNASKTLAKFVPYCVSVIKYELAHGASSMRTTSSSSPIPSDATLHWSEFRTCRDCSVL